MAFTIRSARLLAGDWTKTKFAEQLRRRGYTTSVSSVSKWERGLEVPSADVLLAIADLVGISVTELLDDGDRFWQRDMARRIDHQMGP